ncbi:MAG TPA: hypothetical protein VIU39_02435 [Anaerolineales bacterium]
MSDLGVIWADPTLYCFTVEKCTVFEQPTGENLGPGRPASADEIAADIRQHMSDEGGTCLCVVRDGPRFVGIGQHLNPPPPEKEKAE